MTILADLRVLYHLLLSPVHGETHAARLESFYGGQAEAYDGFRRRLLHGRAEMVQALDLPEGGVWVDMGAGTAQNLEFADDRLARLSKVYTVDLSPSLLEVARHRVEDRGWRNVAVVEGDATAFTPDEGQADVVTFSYSLTMIPDWFSALENALRILKPGGHLGAVDFHVSRKYPDVDCVRHAWPARTFWPAWFALDNVFLSPDHLPWLHRHLQCETCHERHAPVPYIPLARVPYYIFTGRRI